MGEVRLPQPPGPAASGVAASYVPLAPYRALDTRPASAVGPVASIGALPPHGVIDVSLAGVGAVPATATAVAINLTSTDAVNPSYLQAVPYLHAALGSSSTLNVAQAGAI
ncbi:MAG TPA: hypothetical protein PLV68_15370, partial [Ilumatobacteraceae bacterium]|nr:hypothetical protein [Ilumatobacteraceae bacterium]